MELSLHHGISDATASACIMAAMVAGGRLGKYDEADAFGRAGRAIVDIRGLTAYRAKVYLDFALVNHWSHPLGTNVEILQQRAGWARATGNFAVASYTMNNLVAVALSLGTPLSEVQRQIEESLFFVRWARYPIGERLLTSQLRLVLNLRGLTERFSTFDGDGFEEAAFVVEMETNPQANSLALCWHFIRKLQARFLSGDYEEAYAASGARPPAVDVQVVHGDPGVPPVQGADPGGALRPAVRGGEAVAGRRTGRGAGAFPGAGPRPARRTSSTSWNWSRRSTVVFGGTAWERCATTNRPSALPTMSAWCRTKRSRTSWRPASPSTPGWPRRPAYLGEARRCYQSWGANGKVAQLDQEFLKMETRRPRLTSARVAPTEPLDLMAVAKASQAISMELSWERVARRLLEVALEQGGRIEVACW